MLFYVVFSIHIFVLQYSWPSDMNKDTLTHTQHVISPPNRFPQSTPNMTGKRLGAPPINGMLTGRPVIIGIWNSWFLSPILKVLLIAKLLINVFCFRDLFECLKKFDFISKWVLLLHFLICWLFWQVVIKCLRVCKRIILTIIFLFLYKVVCFCL